MNTITNFTIYITNLYISPFSVREVTLVNMLLKYLITDEITEKLEIIKVIILMNLKM
jgi:hypothetical protein